jgi:hypothetical protein
MSSSLTIVPTRFNANHTTWIEGIRVDFPAKWGSGEGAIICLEDANGGIHQLNLSFELVDKLTDGLDI